MSSLFNRQGWWLAIRPKTLPAAASGVITGTALAWRDGSFQPLPALAALACALLLQIGSNIANDVYDYERGTDAQRKHGPVRVTQSGIFTPRQVKIMMAIVFGLAALCGFYLITVAGWMALIVGIAAILSAIAYTGGPFPLGYYGLGDLFVFIFFGIAAVAGTYWVQAGTVSDLAWIMSVPIGFLIVDILVVNNLRDIDNDRAAGKNTLAVRLGVRWTRIEYAALMIASYAILPLLAWINLLPWMILIVWLAIPLAWKTTQKVLHLEGAPLNAALAGTGQTVFLYSILFFVGIMLEKFLK
jgi:1,4-dihydroxy-2-naphthoate octaprenyltransferase